MSRVTDIVIPRLPKFMLRLSSTTPCPKITPRQHISLFQRLVYFIKNSTVISISSCSRICTVILMIITRQAKLFQHNGFIQLTSNNNMFYHILGSQTNSSSYILRNTICIYPTPIFRPDMHCKIIDIFIMMDFFKQSHIIFTAHFSFTPNCYQMIRIKCTN